MKAALSKVVAHGGLALLVVIFLAALARVLMLQSGAAPSKKIILRIAHWQMETDVRAAMEEAARGYEKLHPDVEVRQIGIGERGYDSWVITRLIGGTAPDLIALRPMDRLVMAAILQRYFLPLSDEVEKPNPYNKGTSLEGVPWKETYYDGMAGGLVAEIPELLDYYRVPTSAATVRLFYNKRLFREATGMAAPPATFREFIEACERIKQYGRRKGMRLVPIAGAGKSYNTRELWKRFDQVMNSRLLAVTDVNHDGELSAEESLIALVGGAVDFRDPRIRAMYRGQEAYNREFQPAFFAAERMDAAFLFLQQRAVMIASGSWDLAGYAREADFEIGVCDFPLPAADDPDFGQFVQGPAQEQMLGGFAFSVNRLSPHRDTAVDFLKFLSSQAVNATMNARTKWIPLVRGNAPDPSLAVFWPHLDGVKEGIQLNAGGENLQRFEELQSLHATGRLDFDGFMDRYIPTFAGNADAWMRTDRLRGAQLAAAQDEFLKVAEREAGAVDKSLLVLEGQISREHSTSEFTSRYEAARAKDPR